MGGKGGGDSSMSPTPNEACTAENIQTEENEIRQPYIKIKSVLKPSQINNENLQIENKEIILPPQDIKYEKKEKIKEKNMNEREKRYAEREKLRKDIEIYGDIFYDWEEILREREEKMRREENERNLRKGKATSLSKTWELMKICKEFLGEWEAEWTMGTEKARSLQTERKLKETDKEERFRKIELKKENF